jgi:hypothetical protein
MAKNALNNTDSTHRKATSALKALARLLARSAAREVMKRNPPTASSRDTELRS